MLDKKVSQVITETDTAARTPFALSSPHVEDGLFGGHYTTAARPEEPTPVEPLPDRNTGYLFTPTESPGNQRNIDYNT